MAGGSGDDLLKGGSGNDDPGFDVGPMVRGLYGGPGDDAVYGGGQRHARGRLRGDLLRGGSSNDSIGDPGAGAYDEIYCGEGRDFVEASAIDYVASDCETVERY